jgi:UDP-glucose-4-epimerase GalE
MSKVLVTGVSGYIGGQTALLLKDQGHTVYGVDLVLPGAAISSAMTEFCHSDFVDITCIELIDRNKPDAIIHCAGTSLVGPSILNPEAYYYNNFAKTLILLNHLVNSQSQARIIFSSSAAVYGDPIMNPCGEWDMPMPINPYGESKYMVEMMLNSYRRAYNVDFVAFRYFNACGADQQARHGQAPGSTHIIARVLESVRDKQTFTMFGNEYPTPDGTCMRDYVHVEDIAQAHIMAISDAVPSGIYNLGLGQGISNQQIVDAVAIVVGRQPVVELGPARDGDPAALTADPGKIYNTCGWKPKYSLQDMIQHAWVWCNR